jgi:phosphopantetheinyl transferase
MNYVRTPWLARELYVKAQGEKIAHMLSTIHWRAGELYAIEAKCKEILFFIFYFYLKYFAITNNTDYNINNRYTETWLGDHHSSVG